MPVLDVCTQGVLILKLLLAYFTLNSFILHVNIPEMTDCVVLDAEFFTTLQTHPFSMRVDGQEGVSDKT